MTNKKIGFNRSQWTKNRWKVAGEQQVLYNEKFKSNISKKEFYKTDNPLTQQVVKYKVTFEMKNKETGYKFFIPQGSYTIYALKGVENIDKIKHTTKGAILDKFIGGQQIYIDKKLDVKVEEHKIRGLEEEPLKYDEVDYELLKFKNSYTLDRPKLEINKISKSKNKSIFDYDLDI